MTKLNQSLKELFSILSSSNTLDFSSCPVTVGESQIITPVGDVIPILLAHKNKLNENIINLDLLKKFVYVLDSKQSLVRLNHIGFGYKVESQAKERQRLIQLAKRTDLYLYEEESNDFGLWLFLGNTQMWQKPLIEFVPVQVEQQETDFFLPHIQIDIDTALDAKEIEKMVEKTFGGEIEPYRVAVIDGITYIVRSRIGVIDGVNIFIDLATNARNVKYHRQHFLKRIVR